MNESPQFEIRFKPQAAGNTLLPDELALLESILPDLIHAMMQAEAENETD